MAGKTLPDICFEMLSEEVALERVSGFDDIENVKLLSGDEGGGIKIYRGEKIDKVTIVDFKLGRETMSPFGKNEKIVEAEIFQILPDFSYKIPVWGINSVITEDGKYAFDTDFSFGFDLVQDYDFVMKYLDPFNEEYKKFCNHKDLEIVRLDTTTTWVRSYISPVFIIAETQMEKMETVYDLCGKMIRLWAKIYSDAENLGEDFKKSQQARLQSQYSGMKDTDRMGHVIRNLYGEETFGKFFKAMV